MENKKLFVDMGNRIRKRRVELGYTQEYIAEVIDTTPQTISDTENGKKGLKLENFAKFCRVLDVTADYLLTGRELPEVMFKDFDKLTDKQAEHIKNVIENCIGLCDE